MKDKRREQRLLCAELVQITYRDESGRNHRRVANLEDICVTGLCLQSEVRIPDGTRMTVNYAGGKFLGSVRYCVFRDTGYLLGIEFEAGSRWSTRDFQPEHLLDPRRLVQEMVH